MAPGVVRVVLPGVVLCNDQIESEIKDKACFSAERLLEEFIELVLPDDGGKCKERPGMQGIAAPRGRLIGLKVSVREMLEKIFIRLHQGIFRIGNKLPDDDALRHIEFALGIVDAIRFEEYVDACALFLRTILPVTVGTLTRLGRYMPRLKLSVVVTLNFSRNSL